MLLFTANLGAQELRVKSVRFEDRVDTVVVMYDLDGRDNKRYEVSLSLSFDGGKTYTIYPDHVSGDVGRGVRPGLGKRMEWNLNEDYPAVCVGLTRGGDAHSLDEFIEIAPIKSGYQSIVNLIESAFRWAE